MGICESMGRNYGDRGGGSDTFLQSLLARYASATSNALRRLIHAEPEYFQSLRRSVSGAQELLRTYQTLAPGPHRELARDLLIASSNPEVENYAIMMVRRETGQIRSDWLAMLSEFGARSREGRAVLLTLLPSLNDPVDIRATVQALTPNFASSQELKRMFQALEVHAEASDEWIRRVAVELAPAWGVISTDDTELRIVERGLLDVSPMVRETAIYAAFSSNIRSEDIKVTLVMIMSNQRERIDLRTSAYSALRRYKLNEAEQDIFNRFHSLLDRAPH